MFSESAKGFAFSREKERQRILFHVCSCGFSNSMAEASSRCIAAALLRDLCPGEFGMQTLKHVAPRIKALYLVTVIVLGRCPTLLPGTCLTFMATCS